ncbi:MAG: histidine phosphatase family protein [Alphaproteobacteria bacterium]
MQMLATALIIAFAAIFPVRAAETAFDTALLARDEGLLVLYRHALAPGVGDPAGFDPRDCATQRNLDAAGRAQARRMGDRLREAGLKSPRIFTSRWCRSRDTARLLGFGQPEELPALDSFFQQAGEATERTRALRDFIAGLPSDSPTIIMVTHQVNITALTGVFPASGAGVVAAGGRNGEEISLMGVLPAP